jgi:hypothetical protein
METTKDWDEEMGWDRDYAKKAIMSDMATVKENMPRLLRGRTTESIIEDVRKNGIASSFDKLRKTVFAGLGISRQGFAGAPLNIIKIGCNGFATLPILHNYCVLLQKLGINYDFLSKEYCCLAPALYGVLMRGQDRTIVDESARKMMKGNVAQAKVSGGKNMVNFCLYCHWRAKWLLGDSDMPQLYAFDILTPSELWRESHMQLKQTIGYLSMGEGTANGRLRVYVPNIIPAETVKTNWQGYRNLLNRIEGLKIIDINNYTYPQDSSIIWEQMRSNNLETLIVNHPHEYTVLKSQATKELPNVKIRFLSDIILQALGGDLW